MGEFEKVSCMALGSLSLSIFAQQDVFRIAVQSLRDISQSSLSKRDKEQKSRNIKDARRELLLHFSLFTPALVTFVFYSLPFFPAVFTGSYANIFQALQKYPGGLCAFYFILGGLCGVLPIETIKRIVRSYVKRILKRRLKGIENAIRALGDGDDDVIDEKNSREEEEARKRR